MSAAQDYRQLMYGDLPLIKQIIESGNKCKTRADGTIPLSAWNNRIKGWVLNELKHKSHSTQLAFQKEIEIYHGRMKHAQDFIKQTGEAS